VRDQSSDAELRQIADYLLFVALRAASTDLAQIGLFWRGLPVPWWLDWPTGVSRAGGPHLVWQRQLALGCGVVSRGGRAALRER
jgi:hypothetical protein